VSPVFLLATGWRTGSTLVQRILMTDGGLLLWGEPLGRAAIVPRMVEMLLAVSRSWPPNDFWIGAHPDPSGFATTWIANLFPPGRDLKTALRQLFDRWLGEPASQRGFVRWGLKEVRLGAADAILLHWLFPRATFVLLSRHPCDAYRSASGIDGGRPLYARWPDAPVESVAAFARHWNRLAVSWSELPADVPYLRLRYEDIVANKVDWRELESRLGLRIRERDALAVRIGGTAKRRTLTWHERFIIERECATGIHALGY
jgi:hypothetical protein